MDKEEGSCFSISPDGYLSDRVIHESASKLADVAPGADLLAIELTRMIVKTWGLLHREIAPTWAAFEVSNGRYGVLWALFESEAPSLTMSEIAKRLTVTQPNVTQLIGSLENIGLVERRQDPRDRRVVRVALTSAGEARLRAVTPEAAGRFQTLLSALSPHEKQLLTHLLAKVLLSNIARPKKPYAPDRPPLAPD